MQGVGDGARESMEVRLTDGAPGHPITALVDRPLALVAPGARTGEPWDVEVEMVDLQGRRWRSATRCRVGPGGHLAPDGPSADPMRPFWSLELPPDEPLSAPPMGLEVLDERLAMPTTVVARAAGAGPVLRADLVRTFLAAGVEARWVEGTGFTGRLFAPPGAVRAALIVLTGSPGGLVWSHETAALLASHGYLALALAYFGRHGLPDRLVEIPVEVPARGLEWLAAEAGADPARLGVVGVSRGGELALLLASAFAGVRAAVAYVPANAALPGVAPVARSAWSLHGRPVPIGTEIPVERSRGSLLLLSAGDDRAWPSAAMSEAAYGRLRRLGDPTRSKHLSWRGAGHLLRPPGLPTTATHMPHPLGGAPIPLGGDPHDHAAAEEESWRAVLEFLARELAGP